MVKWGLTNHDLVDWHRLAYWPGDTKSTLNPINLEFLPPHVKSWTGNNIQNVCRTENRSINPKLIYERKSLPLELATGGKEAFLFGRFLVRFSSLPNWWSQMLFSWGTTICSVMGGGSGGGLSQSSKMTWCSKTDSSQVVAHLFSSAESHLSPSGSSWIVKSTDCPGPDWCL